MTISAKVIADSISPEGHRITSVQLRYPKFIHGELMTHRVFSRNAASSRAIPVARMIQDVIDDPAMPVSWGKNQKGMQATQEFDAAHSAHLQAIWLHGRDRAVETVTRLMDEGVHKQIANRILEPWFHITTLVTATEWDNFFELRCDKDAQPEMQTLANAIAEQMDTHQPKLLALGEWHLPYVTSSDTDWLAANGYENTADPYVELRKTSVARCARVSYLTQDGLEPSLEQDLELYHKLVVARPIHASPAEHQATPDRFLRIGVGGGEWQYPHEWRNFKGWRQYRAMIDQ